MDSTYVYITSEPQTPLYTVGFYDPSGKWQPESDWNTREQAANRVSMLNGGRLPESVEKVFDIVKTLLQSISDCTIEADYPKDNFVYLSSIGEEIQYLKEALTAAQIVTHHEHPHFKDTGISGHADLSSSRC